MKEYHTLIFDLDDTLVNDSKSIEYAFYEVYKYLGYLPNPKVYEEWLKQDKAYWYKWDTNQFVMPKEITSKADIASYRRSLRFIYFFKELHLNLKQAQELNQIYINNLGINIEPMPHAKEIIEYLSSNYSIIIGTNGPQKAAFEKLRKAQIEEYVDKVICSEEIGYSKPKKEFFDFLFQQISELKERTLLIGDSLTTDIQGGMNYKIDTCWFNFQDEFEKDYKPTYIIQDLLELKKILK